MAIELVLNYGMDANVPAERNITPLLWASTAASSLSIKTLIDLGADVNARAFVDRSSCFYTVAPHFILQSLATIELSLTCYLQTRWMRVLVTKKETHLFIYLLPSNCTTFHSC